MDSQLVDFKEGVLKKRGVNNTYKQTHNMTLKAKDYALKVFICKCWRVV
jgi:hypothetical protein